MEALNIGKRIKKKTKNHRNKEYTKKNNTMLKKKCYLLEYIFVVLVLRKPIKLSDFEAVERFKKKIISKSLQSLEKKMY